MAKKKKIEIDNTTWGADALPDEVEAGGLTTTGKTPDEMHSDLGGKETVTEDAEEMISGIDVMDLNSAEQAEDISGGGGIENEDKTAYPTETAEDGKDE